MSNDLFAIARRGEGVVSMRISTDEDRHLSSEWVEGFLARLDQLEQEGSARVLILEGSESYFSAGASLWSLTQMAAGQAAVTYAAKAARGLLELSIPVISAASGHAIGGGLVLALWCDAVVLGVESLYGVNFTANGFTPGMGATYVVLEAFCSVLGRELLYTGRLMMGEEIQRSGCPISHTVLPRSLVMDRALAVAREIALTPAATSSLLKGVLAAPRIEALEKALAAEDAARARLIRELPLGAEIANRYPASPSGFEAELET